MKSFGASAPLKDLLKHFGFTVENVLKAAREQLSGGGKSPTEGGPSGADERGAATMKAK